VSIIYKALKQLEQLPETKAVVMPKPGGRPNRGFKWLIIGILSLPIIMAGVHYRDLIIYPLTAWLTEWVKIKPTSPTIQLPKPIESSQKEGRHYQHLAFIPPDPLTQQEIRLKPVAKVTPPIHRSPRSHQSVKPKITVPTVVKATPTVDVDALVQSLYRAISANQALQVKHLLAQLSQQMGAQDGFVIKLKAYWLLTQKHYSQVETLLRPYLLQQPKDLEAGINLSIAEMQRDPAAAVSRLKQLNQWYPDNQTVQGLLAQVAR